jgi:glycosyltransferase involved in cell wall biosynthesis
MEYSFIIPVYNEAANVATLHAEVLEVAKKLSKSFEIIFVNDGSSDQTQKVLESLKPITIVELPRNFGQTAALDAGIKTAQGKYIITLDGDGQNDPASIPDLIAYLHATDSDVVCGWRKDRQDNFVKRFISRGAQLLRSRIINDKIHDSGCTLRVYRRECFSDITFRGEMHRFIPILLRWQGFKVSELPVGHRSRKHGQSKYTISRTVTGFLDMLSLWFFHKFQSRPLHFLGTIGGSLFLIGTTLLFCLGIARLFWQFPLANKIWPLLAVFFILFGFQMFVSGLIMDLITSQSDKELYIVKKTHKFS